jgi:glutamyl-tRNA synthetase
MPTTSAAGCYRGRIAPSPTGLLHLGHALTFWTAFSRARAAGGAVILREDDLDAARCTEAFALDARRDMRWFGLSWDEGPDVGGPFGPYRQSQRRATYEDAFEHLKATGHLYPCTCSRKDVVAAAAAPHAGDEGAPYPGTCRSGGVRPVEVRHCWRFRVPDGRTIRWRDLGAGDKAFEAGLDFGDFVVRRHDGTPSYQLACVVDDHCMSVTEVVRGGDLLLSTARQLLIFEALGWKAPDFFHTELVCDQAGRRLAKRHDALSLAKLRRHGWTPEQLRATPAQEVMAATEGSPAPYPGIMPPTH